MKRFLVVLLVSMGALCLHAQQDTFDPANPGDPQPFYTLQVEVSPSAGGTANISRTMVEAGQSVSLQVTPKTDFTFLQWVWGDSILSSNTWYSFTMPAANVTLTAQLLYDPQPFNPESPGDPQTPPVAVPRHQVTVYVSPSTGGSVNNSAFYMEEGAQQNVYAYPNSGYEFVGWMQDATLSY